MGSIQQSVHSMKLSGDRNEEQTQETSVMLERYLTDSEPSIVNKLAGPSGECDGRAIADARVRRTTQRLDALVEQLKQAAVLQQP